MRGLGLRWVVVALAMHGLVVALLLLLAPVRREHDLSTLPPRAPDSLDLEPSEPLAEPGPAIASAAAARLATTPAASRAPFRGAPPDAAGESPAPSASGSAAFDRPLDLSAAALGLDGRNPFLAGLPGAPDKAPSAGSRERNEAPGMQQSVRDVLQEHDRQLGLGAGGPIVGLAEDVARASATPWNSRATFEVVADARGVVTAVRLVDASEAWGDWERVVADLRDALRRVVLRVPAGAAGVQATLEVMSRFQLPSGHDPVTEVNILGVPVKKAPPTAKQPMHVDILKPQISMVDVARSPDLNAPIKLPEKQLVIGVTILGLAVDPTDLTPRPLRVVHARVTREHVL